MSKVEKFNTKVLPGFMELLPEEKLPVLIDFARFLNQSDLTGRTVSFVDSSAISQRRREILGILKGQVHMAEDFNETPDVFKEYL